MRALIRVAGTAFLLFVAGGVALAPDPAIAAALRPGDVLVVDLANARVLRVDGNGGVASFSPPPATTNLLDSPSGIGVGPDGTIVVANETGSLVQLDPASGAQSLVEGLFSGPPDLGVEPQDVAVNPRAPAPGFAPSLFIGALGELRLVVRSALSTDGIQLAPFPDPWGTYETYHVAAWAPNETDPFDVFASIGSAVLRYGGVQDTITTFWTPPYGVADGLDVQETSSPIVGIAWRNAACPASTNGIYLVDPSSQPAEFALSTAGLLACPRGIAWLGGRYDAYALDVGQDPPRLIRIDQVLAAPPIVTQRVAATLPSGTDPVDLAVYTPEPGEALGRLVAMFALAAVGRLGGSARNPVNRRA
jgi:hypothetical protein